MNILKTSAVALAALALLGCEQREWQGWVYPDKNNLPDDIPIGTYGSLEECRASAQNILKRLGDADLTHGDYECGYQCKPASGGLNICEKTER